MGNNYIIDISTLNSIIQRFNDMEEFFHTPRHYAGGKVVPVKGPLTVHHWSDNFLLKDSMWKDGHSDGYPYKEAKISFKGFHFKQVHRITATAHGVGCGLVMTPTVSHITTTDCMVRVTYKKKTSHWDKVKLDHVKVQLKAEGLN